MSTISWVTLALLGESDLALIAHQFRRSWPTLLASVGAEACKPAGTVRRFLVVGIAMPLFRLIGLALFITAIFLALAAAITKTTRISIQLPDTSYPTQQPNPSDSAVLPPPIEPGFGSELPQTGPHAATKFTSVPILWPLIIAAGVGLLMWFAVPSETNRTPRTSVKRSSRRRK